MRRILLIAASALAVLAPSLSLAGPAAAVAGLPTDPAAHGYIGFCDEAGHNVTGGSIDTAPFAWKAVASTAPPAQYQGAGQNAVLNAYQPRPEIEPAEWSGLSLTAASFYSNKAHPAVQATYADQSMKDFIAAFPAKVNGLYVLRMYFGKANYGLYNTTYPTTTIQVVGSHWSVVSGGTVDCAAARGVSNEQLTGVVTKKQFTAHRTPPAGQTLAAGTSGTSGTKPASIVKTPTKAGASAAADSNAAPGSDAANTSASGPDTSGSTGWVWFVVVPLALVVLVLALLLWRRHRTATGIDPDPS